MSRSDAHQYRKDQRMLEQTHGGNAGRSIIEQLEQQLDLVMGQYLDCKRDRPLGVADVAMKRGEVRGLARAVSMMRNPYRPVAGIKQVEKDSAARVRSQRDEAEAHTEQA